MYSAFMLTREVCKMGNFSKDGEYSFFSSVMGSYGEKGKIIIFND